MGNMSYFSNSTGKKTEFSFLILGPENSGKTTCLLNLVYPENNIIAIPTTGFNSDRMNYKDFTLHILDMTKSEWYKQSHKELNELIGDRDAMMFFVDWTKINESSYKQDVILLFKSFLRLDVPESFPFIIVMNKCDLLAEEPDPADIIELLELDKIRDRKWYVKAASAKTRNGLNECLDLLVNSIQGKIV